MTFDQYRAIDAVNFSSLKHLHVSSSPLLTSPMRYRHHKAFPSHDETDAMRLGKATHTAVFEPDRLLLEYAVWTGDRRAGPKWTAFEEAAGGRTILTENQYGRALAIRDAVRAHPIAATYLERGEPEKTITWTDAATGLLCKGRLDWFSHTRPCVVDLKTTRDIDARAFGAMAARMGYHRQLAMYVAGALANDLFIVPRAVIIAVESAAPHEVAVFTLDENSDALTAGAEEIAELLATLKTCIETDNWPGRYEFAQTLELPHWLYDEGDDSEALENAGFRRASGE